LGKRFHIILKCEGISDRRAIKLLFKELENHPYINSAEIRYGGFFREKVEKRNFQGERVYEGLPERILVQQFESRFLNRQEMKDRIKSLRLQIKELEANVGAD
jgi:hypothetical protein